MLKLLDVVKDLYAPLKGISDRTVEIYGFTLRKYGEFLGRDPTVADLEELQIAQFLAHRLRTRSPGCAAKDRTQLRAIWQFCLERGLTAKWPQLRRIVVPERVPQAWQIDELQRLLDACGQEPGLAGGCSAADWFRAIILTAYWTGERIGALLSMEWRDVSEDAILFRAECRKGRREDIYRPIPSECREAIERLRGDRKFVFEWDRSHTLIWGRLGKICKRAGLPDDRLSKFHRIRKTAASYFQAAGGSAQQLMGHANPQTTRRYLDPRIVRAPSAVDMLPRVG